MTQHTEQSHLISKKAKCVPLKISKKITKRQYQVI